MFENCIVKWNSLNGEHCSIQVKYPINPDGSRRELSVPIHEGNTDYDNIMKWVADGNTIQEAD